MITEDYVSFETAKLLKENGFSENTEHEIWYVIKQFSTGCHWNSCTYKVGDTTREYDDDCCIPMPTLQMAMKWLREVHNLSVRPRYDEVEDGKEHLYYVWFFDILSMNPYKTLVKSVQGYSTYEEACEAAIKHCLENLI